MKNLSVATLCVMVLLALPGPNRASDWEHFEKKIRPLLVTHCLDCHGAKKQKGGLRLDTRAAMLRGGDSGAVLVPNDPQASLIVRAVRYDGEVKMPPRGRLSDAEIMELERWVKSGAPWPEDPSAGSTGLAHQQQAFDLAGRAKAHWAFQPIRPVEVPPGSQHPIDAFIEAGLREAGLSLSPEADRRTLIRRLSYDLIGLPPSPEEIVAFEQDTSADAYEKVVDRLLASPQYGVRWARHWLDLVRFAETYGHEFDFEIPNAWRYRDYVVRALNEDVPYDQFVREHIAGDLLPNPRRHPQDHSHESIQATGFWFFHEAKHSPVDSRADYADRIDNQIDVFGKAFLGLTLACARCHDHKFDPISTRDYYSLFGMLASSRYQQALIDDPTPTLQVLEAMRSQRAVAPAPWPPSADEQSLLKPDWRQRWFAAGLGLRDLGDGGYPHSGRESVRLTAALRSPTMPVEKPFLAVRVAGQNTRVRFVLNGLELIRHPIYGGLEHKINHGLSFRWLTFDLSMWQGQPGYLEFLDEGPGWFAVIDVRWMMSRPSSVKATATPDASGGLVEAAAPPRVESDELSQLEARIAPPRFAPAMTDGNGRNERVMIRGHPRNLGEEVPRRSLEVFGGGIFTTAGSGRLQLAEAIVQPENPLLARVMVNRLWKHHFGEGIVRTPDDFGLQGQPPTHPELLDWLARQFPTRGWSLKAMHRLMVTSRAYRQASQAPAEIAAKAARVDPLNKRLHRQNVRRLEAEAIRDTLLALSGRLDLTLEGPGVLPFLTPHVEGRGKPGTSGPLDGNGRRSLYLQVRRNFLNPMFLAFDFPTPFTTIGRRTTSNVPAQALAMLNNPFVLQQAEGWAQRVLSEKEDTDEARLRKMYLAGFAREPTSDELTAVKRFLNEFGSDRVRAWTHLAHVLLNTKELILIF